MKWFYLILSACLAFVSRGFADTLIFSNDSTVSGIILETNNNEISLLADNGVFVFSKSKLKEIKVEPMPEAQFSGAGRLPDFKNTVLFLSKQSWATNLVPIPATVIDKGVLKNVPYSSFRCGEDYELNVYGDWEHPAGIEVGIYRKLINDPVAKANCLKFVRDILNQPPDKEVVQNLNLKTDYKTLGDLAFEVTPPTDVDSYNGWWISVYSERELGLARASDEEMGKISVAKVDAAKQLEDAESVSGWSANELKLARTPTPKIIKFVNSSGVMVTNAEVVRIIDGVSLIYRTGPIGGGMVKLADLPENLQAEFGYDAVKTEAADALAKEQKAQWHQQALAEKAALQSQASTAAQYASQYPQYYNPADYSGEHSSGGGRVYVHSYYRKNGTHVNGYYRR